MNQMANIEVCGRVICIEPIRGPEARPWVEVSGLQVQFFGLYLPDWMKTPEVGQTVFVCGTNLCHETFRSFRALSFQATHLEVVGEAS